MTKYVRRLRSLGIHEVLLSVGLFFTIGVIGLLWWDGARQPYIDNNFSYSADLIETNNVYDPANSRFTGARYGTANMFLERSGTNEAPLIKSKRVSESGGETKTISREGRADAQTGRYIDESGMIAAEGSYVFAPRELTKERTFFYKHLSYDAPALMRFVEEDTIDGLVVYKYKADFTYLQRVEETQQHDAIAPDQGLEYTPDLYTWIEPVSGWMVKYQEDTTLNIFERASGRIVRPVRHFSTRMTDATIAQHVAYAKSLHVRYVFASQIAPSIILLIMLFIIFSLALIHMRSSKMIPLNAVLAVITIVPAAVLFGWLINAPPLITLFIDFVGMNPMSALCFILVGMAILARRHDRRLVVAFFGGIICIVSFLQLLGGLDILPFQVDLLLFRDAVLAFSETIPSRMSPYEAFTFFLLGAVLVKAGLSGRHTVVHFARFVSGVVVMMGVFGVILQFLQLEKTFALTFVQSLPVVSLLLFIVAGFTLLNLFRRINDIADDVKSTIWALRWPSLATIPIIIIGAFAQVQQNIVQQSLQVNFAKTTAEMESSIASRIDIYANTLTGARALFASSQDVTKQEWRNYMTVYDLPKQYPGILDAGFAKIVPGSSKQIKPDPAQPPIAIFPQANSALHAPIVYIEPMAEVSSRQIGYDLFSDIVRLEAMEQARDSGKPRLSNKLVQPAGAEVQQGDVLLFVPVYKREMPLDTVEQRRLAIDGYVFGSINMRKFLSSVIGTKVANVDFEVYDGLDTKSEALMYRLAIDSRERPRLTEKSTLFIAGQPWTIVYAAQPSFRLSLQEELSPSIILLGGTTAYFTIVALVYLLTDYGRRGRIKEGIRRIKLVKKP